MLEFRGSPVLVVDLDGTILRVNSFPRWVLFLIRGRIPGLSTERRAGLSMRALYLLLVRKMGLVDHDALLRGVQRAWSSAAAEVEDGLLDGFQAQLLRHVRPNVLSVLDLVATDQLDAVLATAAAADYAEGLGERLGFRHVLATRRHRGPHEPPNRGPHKRDRVLAFLDDRGWAARPLILLTDHIDDMPLIRVSRMVCWFGSSKTMPMARITAGDANFIAFRDLSDSGVLVTLLAMCGGVTHPPVNPDIQS